MMTRPLLPLSIALNDWAIGSRMPKSANVFNVGFFVSIEKSTRSPLGTPALMKETTQSVSLKLVANFVSCFAFRSAGFNPRIFLYTTNAASAVGRSIGGSVSQTPSIRYRSTAP